MSIVSEAIDELCNGDTHNEIRQYKELQRYKNKSGITGLVDIGYGLFSGTILLTVKLAKIFIGTWKNEEIGGKARNKRPGHLKKMSNDLINGFWHHLNGEVIIFDKEGRMIDGQHRCQMVIDTGKPILTAIIYGVDTTAYVSIDLGALRTVSDGLAFFGEEHSKVLAPALRILWCYENDVTVYDSSQHSSPEMNKYFLDKHQEMRNHTSVPTGLETLFRGKPVYIFLHYVLYNKNKGAAMEFFEKLNGIGTFRPGDPVNGFRDWLTKRKGSKEPIREFQDQCIKAASKAWTAHIKGKTILKFRLDGTEKYEFI